MASRSRKQLENWLKTIEVKTSCVADIGGSQLPIKGRTKSWDVSSYRIFDLQEPHEKKQAPHCILDLNNDFNNLFKNRFNIIFCIEVFEYVFNPFNALKQINSMLKNEGILYLSIPYTYGLHNPIKDDCLRYTEQGIKKLLQHTNFKDIKIIKREVKEESKHYLSQFYKSEGMKINYNGDWSSAGYLIKCKKYET